MRIDAPSPTQLHALAASIGAKLIAFAAWVVEWSAFWPFQAAVKRRLRAQLRRGCQAFQRIVLLIAVQRIAPPQRAKRAHRPVNAPPGFRMQTGGQARRFMRISGLHAGSIKHRIARLKRMIETIERWVAHMLKRFANRAKKSRLAIVYAIAAFCDAFANTTRVCAADTS